MSEPKIVNMYGTIEHIQGTGRIPDALRITEKEISGGLIDLLRFGSEEDIHESTTLLIKGYQNGIVSMTLLVALSVYGFKEIVENFETEGKDNETNE